MKKMFMIIASLAFAFPARGQMVVTDPNNFIQGIINTANMLLEGGKTTEGILKNFERTTAIYEQNKEYFDKLKQVNKYVQSYWKVAECLDIADDITLMYVVNYPEIVRDHSFSDREVRAIGIGYNSIMIASSKSIADLKPIIFPSGIEMNDNERIRRVDKIHRDLTRYRATARNFTYRNRSLAQSRSLERQSGKLIISIYKRE